MIMEFTKSRILVHVIYIEQQFNVSSDDNQSHNASYNIRKLEPIT